MTTDPARRALMQRVRQKGTPAEQTVAAICREMRIGYRLNVRSLPGSPDIANKTRRWAIFVNGCFWHQHRGCPKATMPKRNGDFWREKFIANRRRDAAKIRALRKQGFRVIVIWECAPEAAIRRRLSKLGEPGVV